MRLLFIIDSLGTGGAERSTAELWYYLKRQKIPFRIIALIQRTEGIQKEILDAGLQVEILKDGNFIRNVWQIIRRVRSYDPTLVHSVLFKSNLRTRFVKLLTQSFTHIEALVNTTYSSERFNDKNVNAFALQLYKIVDCVTEKFLVNHFIANTEDIRLHYVRHLKINPAKITVIYRGRRENPFIAERSKYRQLLRQELSLSDDALILIIVARQEYQKGLIYALKAFHDIIESYSNARLILVGRKGSSTQELITFYEEFKLKDRVFFLGHRTDIMQLLVGADIFIFPSVYEGIGGAIIEALAAGLPIVSSDLPGLREVIGDSNAIFVEPKTREGLAHGIRLLIQDSAIRDSMSKLNIKLFTDRFQLDSAHNQVMEVYKKF